MGGLPGELFQEEERQDESTAPLPFGLPLELTVTDRDVVAALVAVSEGTAREEYALAALKIGILALRQAQGQLDADVIQRESERMLADLNERLAGHSRELREHLAGTLKHYFDPDSGHFQQRVQRLVGRDGELEQLLGRQLAGEDSQLAKTLLTHVGHESPLLKMLDPEESSGLLTHLRQSLEDQLAGQRKRILDEFSLDNKQGALSRLVVELTENHGELNDALQKKIDEVVKEFSLDSDESALSRLVRNVTTAQKTITDEFSLDNKESALARLKGELVEMLAEHEKANREFREEVNVALGQLAARREEQEKSPRHGLAFEDAVIEYLSREAQHAGDVALPTGTTTGLIKNCKVGDCVVELGPDSAAPGEKIVVEAKEKENYSFANAREEIERARKNRDAQLGLFVFSRKTAPREFGPFKQLGQDLYVIWDPEDPSTDIYLHAAVLSARALCIRRGRLHHEQQADFTSIDRAILEIEKQAERLAEVETWTNTIQSSAQKILSRVGRSRQTLAGELETLREKLTHVRQVAGEN
ncbi:MAG: hypothetical protein DWQ31_00610 [Planctomycetota bacterium]|nr:MAG: hypothetical protein DWQ31_00610 [Planctomycetota bacterium]REJ86691.1 MAG: hypothetical protein DWQ35_22950 [Planctomycetota bacterium]